MTTIETRQQILQVAAELFADQGIAATPLREIAERLEFTKAALYYHFPSKDHLLATLITPLHDDLGAVLSRAEELPSRPAPQAVLVGLLEAHLANHDATRLTRDPAVRQVDRLLERGQQLRARAVAALVGAQAEPARRLKASAALAVVEDLAVRCSPDEHTLARQVASTAAALFTDAAPLTEPERDPTGP